MRELIRLSHRGGDPAGTGTPPPPPAFEGAQTSHLQTNHGVFLSSLVQLLICFQLWSIGSRECEVSRVLCGDPNDLDTVLLSGRLTGLTMLILADIISPGASG
jgi:hypothetical protein